MNKPRFDQDLAHWLRILRQLQAELQDMLLSDGTDDEEFSSKIFEPAAASLAGLPGGDKAGYLLKRGRSTNIWKGRWFVLKDKVLQYYKVRFRMGCFFERCDIAGEEGKRIYQPRRHANLLVWKRLGIKANAHIQDCGNSQVVLLEGLGSAPV